MDLFSMGFCVGVRCVCVCLTMKNHTQVKRPPIFIKKKRDPTSSSINLSGKRGKVCQKMMISTPGNRWEQIKMIDHESISQAGQQGW